jgi:hypothetical protein
MSVVDYTALAPKALRASAKNLRLKSAGITLDLDFV